MIADARRSPEPAGRRFSATSRSSRVSQARYTCPNEPCPTGSSRRRCPHRPMDSSFAFDWDRGTALTALSDGALRRWNSAMAAKTFSCLAQGLSVASHDSAVAESSGVPSRMASRRSSTGWSLGRTFHLLGKPRKRPPSCLARRLRRRLAERLGDFVVTVAHLHSSDDRFPVFRGQVLECPFVPRHGFTTDGLIER